MIIGTLKVFVCATCFFPLITNLWSLCCCLDYDYLLCLDILFFIFFITTFCVLLTVSVVFNCNSYGTSCDISMIFHSPSTPIIWILYIFSITRNVTPLFYIVSFQLNSCLLGCLVFYYVKRFLYQKPSIQVYP